MFSQKFLAFHVSGGTTEAILTTPDSNDIISCVIAGKTLDLNAGQLIDRIGVLLGLQFPCGAELEKLAKDGTISALAKKYGVENTAITDFADQK